ncbi:MAG: extracellular solute-binding protein [Ilumatobacteraceae bacterium]
MLGCSLVIGCSSSTATPAPATHSAEVETTAAPAGTSGATTDQAASGDHAASGESVQPVDTTTSSTSDAITAEPAPDRCAANTDAGKVIIWHSLGGTSAPTAFGQLVNEFNATHTLQIETIKVGGYSEVISRLVNTPLQQWPDLIIAGDKATTSLMDSGHFLRPAECAGSAAISDALLPAVRARYTVDGNLQALPYGVSTPILMFDKVEYANAGLDPNTPLRSEQDLIDAARKIRKSGASPHGLVIDDSCAVWTAEQYTARRGELLGQPDNGHVSGPVKVNLNTPANVAALTMLRGAVADGSAQYIGANTSTYDDLLKIVDAKDGATMSVHTSASLGDLIGLFQANSFPGAELGVLPLPGPNSGSLAGGNALWIVDHADAQHNGATWSVARWLEDPARMAMFDAATGYVPPTTTVAAEPATEQAWQQHPELKVGYDQLAAMPGTVAAGGLLIGPSAEADSVMQSACTAIMQGGIAPATALSSAELGITKLLAAFDSRS